MYDFYYYWNECWIKICSFILDIGICWVIVMRTYLWVCLRKYFLNGIVHDLFRRDFIMKGVLVEINKSNYFFVIIFVD